MHGVVSTGERLRLFFRINTFGRTTPPVAPHHPVGVHDCQAHRGAIRIVGARDLTGSDLLMQHRRNKYVSNGA
jgi:hypothetical protein